MRKVSTRETQVSKYNLSLKPREKQRIVDYAKSRHIPLSDVLRDGADVVMKCRLPFLGCIPCGTVSEILQTVDYEDYKTVSPEMRPTPHDFLLEAQGDSMLPRIESGDLLLMRPNVEVSNGDVCAVQIYQNEQHQGDCEATLKRVYYEEKRRKVVLRAYNADFEDVSYDAAFVKVVAVLKGIMGGAGRF